MNQLRDTTIPCLRELEEFLIQKKQEWSIYIQNFETLQLNKSKSYRCMHSKETGNHTHGVRITRDKGHF